MTGTVAATRRPNPDQLMFTWPAEDTEDATRWPPRWLARCKWETQYGEQCGREGADDMLDGIRLCGQHGKIAERSVRRYLDSHPRLIRELYWEAVVEPRFGQLPDPGRSVVYFVERQGFVKIGTTTNLEQRIRDIGKGGQMITGMTVGPVRLLATMPGDHRHEKFLHGQFHELRVEGEWFLPDTRLCEFIGRMPNRDADLLDEIEIRHGIAPDEAAS